MSAGGPLADIVALEELCEVLAAQQQRVESEKGEEKLTVEGPSALHDSTAASTRVTAKRRNHSNPPGPTPAPRKRRRRATRRRGRS